ncbi:MAG: ion channel [Candidatus Cloacimonetes bacterium]|jgi:voltage-gated potassium channel|nr:ion channel [Candidatus Cloacimonadota bacterium]MDY0337653.1 ion channel [Candidatus Cloacimonadaceae bacterium]MDD2683875.1 ion channel [Candidatus Cloacimonadota bacterium]MDD3096834.1 ion channel [Candidatus Cloacimonadota bacterium]MDD3578947.1 ion channel [Candidatus Cloacimonadota bacterium]
MRQLKAKTKGQSIVRALRTLCLRNGISPENQKLLLRFLYVSGFIGILLLISAALVWIFESKGDGANTIASFWDGIWWAIVTVATVGYGDKYPITQLGRLVGMMLIIIGFASLSVFTGLIASMFVEDRLKGAKGLKQLRISNHIVICGWNNTGHFFLRALIEKGMQGTEVCLLLNENPEFFESIESKYPSLSLSFVRGEASQEDVLRRACVSAAKQVIVLADHNLPNNAVDDRSIIVANAIHYQVKKEKISVQLLNTENKQLLHRIGIVNALVWDDLGGYLLANNVRDMNNINIFARLAKDAHTHFTTIPIDPIFKGKSYGELLEQLYARDGLVILGLMSREPDLELDKIFDDDTSAIDQFIKSTLSRTRKLGAEDKSSIRINPGRDSIIQDNDLAIVLA